MIVNCKTELRESKKKVWESGKPTLSSTSGCPIFLAFSRKAVMDLGLPKRTRA